MSLTESLITEFGPDIQSLTLIPLGGGIFDVRIGDDLVFSKFKEGRFPANDEVRAMVRQRLAG